MHRMVRWNKNVPIPRILTSVHEDRGMHVPPQELLGTHSNHRRKDGEDVSLGSKEVLFYFLTVGTIILESWRKL